MGEYEGTQQRILNGFKYKVSHSFALSNRYGYTTKKIFECILKGNTVFALIAAHTPISAQSSNAVHFVYFSMKAYVMDTPLNCIDLLMQFK